MSTELASGHGPSNISIYPAYYFSASPTFNKWVKLTAADVHALRHERGFDGQDIYFHLNHPIRYVYLIGPIVAIEVLADGKFFILTLDDSSGATIEIKVERTFVEKRTRVGQRNAKGLPAIRKAETPLVDDTESEKHENQEGDVSHGYKVEVGKTPPHLVPFTAETTTEGVTIVSPCDDPTCYEPHGHVCIGKDIIEVGTVIKAKGRLQVWRDNFQLKLERAFIVRTTDEEAQAWSEYEKFVRTILSHPWQLTLDEIHQLEVAGNEKMRAAEELARKAERHEEMKQQKKKLWAEKKRLHDEKVEKRRAKDAERLNGNALDAATRRHQETVGHTSGVEKSRKSNKKSSEKRLDDVSKQTAHPEIRGSSKEHCRTSRPRAQRRELFDKTNLP